MKAPSMLALALNSTVVPLALTIMNATWQVASAHEPHVLINGSFGGSLCLFPLAACFFGSFVGCVRLALVSWRFGGLGGAVCVVCFPFGWLLL